MKRVSVPLPEELHSRIAQRSRQLGVSVDEYVRGALEAALARASMEGAEDPLLADDAVFDGSAPGDLSAEHDRYLYEEEP